MKPTETVKPHPMEVALGIEAGSTLAALAAENAEPLKPELPSIIDPATGELVPRKLEVTEAELVLEERYEDLKVDKQLDELHRKAVDAFDAQYRLSQEVDPRYSARNAEVAAQYLTVALNTVNSRVDSRYKRGKLKVMRGSAGKPSQTQTNIIVADRNSVLAALFPEKLVEEEKE